MNYEFTFDYDEMDFLQTSLEVILDRQLNSIAEKNIWLKEKNLKLIELKEKIENGKKGFFSNPQNDYDELKRKIEDVYSSLSKNKWANRKARRVYLKILDVRFENDQRHLDLIKSNHPHIFKEDRERPFKDFLREWDKTFF